MGSFDTRLRDLFQAVLFDCEEGTVMTNTMLFYVSIFVFLMMIIGLALTIWEFKNGEPSRQHSQSGAKSKQGLEQQASSQKAA